MKHNDMETLEVLSPELQSALDTLKPVPAPDPAFMAAGRAAFLAEAQEFAAQAVSLTPEPRHKEWKARLKALLTFQWREGPMLVMIKLLLVASLMVGGTVGTVNAAQDSLPGAILYPLKLQLETMEMQRIQDPEMVAEQAMVLMQTRVNEALRLAEQDDVIPPEVGEHYEAHLQLALQTMEQLGEPARTQLQTTLATALADQTRDMDRIRECLQDATCDGDPDMVQTMLKLMERTRDRLDAPEVPPEDGEENREQNREENQEQNGAPDDDEELPDDPEEEPDEEETPPAEHRNENGTGVCDGSNCDGTGVCDGSNCDGTGDGNQESNGPEYHGDATPEPQKEQNNEANQGEESPAENAPESNGDGESGGDNSPDDGNGDHSEDNDGGNGGKK